MTIKCQYLLGTNNMTHTKKLPERPEPHIPEVNPIEPGEPVKYPEIVPGEIPEPLHPAPELMPLKEKRKHDIGCNQHK